jgi:hypothetical protein
MGIEEGREGEGQKTVNQVGSESGWGIGRMGKPHVRLAVTHSLFLLTDANGQRRTEGSSIDEVALQLFASLQVPLFFLLQTAVSFACP